MWCSCSAMIAHWFSFSLIVSICVALAKNIYCFDSSESFNRERAKSWFNTQIGLSTCILNANSIFWSSLRLVEIV
uniref:Putative secreted protein n=1 Tax=Anopheles darlingi TaxID=43151 RepID=A0A2M4D1S0_ANODA